MYSLCKIRHDGKYKKKERVENKAELFTWKVYNLSFGKLCIINVPTKQLLNT